MLYCRAHRFIIFPHELPCLTPGASCKMWHWWKCYHSIHVGCFLRIAQWQRSIVSLAFGLYTQTAMCKALLNGGSYYAVVKHTSTSLASHSICQSQTRLFSLLFLVIWLSQRLCFHIQGKVFWNKTNLFTRHNCFCKEQITCLDKTRSKGRQTGAVLNVNTWISLTLQLERHWLYLVIVVCKRN